MQQGSPRQRLFRRMLSVIACTLCSERADGHRASSEAWAHLPKNEADLARFYERYAEVATSWRPAAHGECSVAPQNYECTQAQTPRLVHPHARPANACKRLFKLGVRNVGFFGDSYMRHVFQATALVLSGCVLINALLRNLPFFFCHLKGRRHSCARVQRGGGEKKSNNYPSAP